MLYNAPATIQSMTEAEFAYHNQLNWHIKTARNNVANKEAATSKNKEKGVWFYLEMNVRDDKKIVDIWLTNAEKNDPVLREGLNDIYKKYKEMKYLVAVFESGEKDLYQGTLDLLAYNKRRIPELEVKKEKQAALW